jgi:hypothetical protein
VCAPMPMIQEPHFSVHVLTVPTVHMTVDTTPVSTVQATVDTVPVVEIPAFEEPAVTHEEERQQPPIQDQDVPHVEPTRRSQRTRRLAISDDYEVYSSEEIQMEGDPHLF